MNPGAAFHLAEKFQKFVFPEFLIEINMSSIDSQWAPFFDHFVSSFKIYYRVYTFFFFFFFLHKLLVAYWHLSLSGEGLLCLSWTSTICAPSTDSSSSCGFFAPISAAWRLRHFVLRFWNQTLTWLSVIPREYANLVRSGPARYFVCSKVFSRANIWCPLNVGRVCFRFPSVSLSPQAEWTWAAARNMQNWENKRS